MNHTSKQQEPLTTHAGGTHIPSHLNPPITCNPTFHVRSHLNLPEILNKQKQSIRRPLPSLPLSLQPTIFPSVTESSSFLHALCAILSELDYTVYKEIVT